MLVSGAVAVFRAVWTIAGRSVLARATATWAAVGLPAAIVFSPQGMRARDLVQAMQTPGVASVVWLGWLALSAPATHAIFTAPGMTAVRARTRPRAVVPALVALATFVHLPWLGLWLRGGGALASMSAASLAVAIATSLFAMTCRPGVRPALTLLAASALSVFAPRLPVGLGLAPLAVAHAWRVAPETRGESWRWTRPGVPPVVALVVVYLLRLARSERLRLVLATMFGSLGAAGLLTLRSDPTPRPGARAVTIMTVPLVLVASLFVAPIRACEEAMHARLRVLGVRPLVVTAAFAVATAAPTTALAATASVATGAPVTPVMGWSIALAVIVAGWGRQQARLRSPRWRGPGAFAVGVALIALVTVTLAMELP